MPLAATSRRRRQHRRDVADRDSPGRRQRSGPVSLPGTDTAFEASADPLGSRQLPPGIATGPGDQLPRPPVAGAASSKTGRARSAQSAAGRDEVALRLGERLGRPAHRRWVPDGRDLVVDSHQYFI